MKNTVEGINSRLSDTEEWISELEDRVKEITTEQKKEKRMKRNEDGLKDLWDNTKHGNIIGVPEEKREIKGLRTYLKT